MVLSINVDLLFSVWLFNDLADLGTYKENNLMRFFF